MEIETKEQASETGETPVAVTPPEARKTRRRNIITFLVAAILNVGLLTLLATQLLTPAHQSVTQNGTPVSGDTLLGQMAPNFTLAALTRQGNQQISLSSYKGKPVVLNFWSSTCAPCQDEIPLLESQWERNQAKGVIFLGVDVEDTAVDGRLFLHQYGMTYPSVIDSNGMTLVSYGVTYTPETIFIDRSGRVVDAVRMEITSQQLQDGLAKILG
jgi:cytochrome c biogenesis protein CcmG/thiol:disulfide interchange protein DsbE